MIGSTIGARLIRKQSRLAKKLERVRAKLARHANGVTSYRVVDNHNQMVSAFRSIASIVAWGAFWWLGCARINSLLDEIFGPEERYVPVTPSEPPTRGQSFWTFGRRMRSGESHIGSQ